MEVDQLLFSEAREVAPGLLVAIAADGRVERWELHNPARRNAVTPAALRWICERANQLDGQTVILTSSAGPFCSGFDLTALREALAEDDEQLPDQVLIDATAAMRRARGIFLAAVRQYAIGAGVELLACCDLRVMGRDAFIEVPAARLGVVYHAAGIHRLRAVFGGQVATRLLALADRVHAPELLHAGAVSHLEHEEAVQARAESQAAALLDLDARAVHQNLRFLRASDDASLDDDQLRAHETARVDAYARARAARAAHPRSTD